VRPATTAKDTRRTANGTSQKPQTPSKDAYGGYDGYKGNNSDDSNATRTTTTATQAQGQVEYAFEYQYDKAHNRTVKVDNGTPIYYVYDGEYRRPMHE